MRLDTLTLGNLWACQRQWKEVAQVLLGCSDPQSPFYVAADAVRRHVTEFYVNLHNPALLS